MDDKSKLSKESKSWLKHWMQESLNPNYSQEEAKENMDDTAVMIARQLAKEIYGWGEGDYPERAKAYRAKRSK